ncbi:hypothetical protein WRSd3_p00050 (plasmid) [Shigella dysenteriae WRSd3]|uniref:Uncharacterized protein n=2 Tax=Shigella TaxID=620 RepID=B2TSP5_SHIB3|nr:hypothetical protein SbBS512_A0051 [Shigella boydii CDC 3083-94]ACD54441.1 hypothetical protein Ec53638_A0335 [Escherichia coli 53638]EGK17241.1 hypothetical protein SFK218_4812 [Shigella flexneri K-218]EJL17524.1 hypothetical protein SSMOSELEY_2151 [Shigella sonnei str. Moseley]ESU75898.1 hypothetical protein WRSd3_p00050 [Shigella dysenteriae WRSd3]ESU76582.1 hypothetical protein WRSd5_p00029 [Shigella dysenteriae WRSd5]
MFPAKYTIWSLKKAVVRSVVVNWIIRGKSASFSRKGILSYSNIHSDD